MPNYYSPYSMTYNPASAYSNYPSYPNIFNNSNINSNGIIWVQGESGAKSYPVAPNGAVALFDSEQQRFFLKSADNMGMPMPLRIFEYREIVANAPKNDFSETDDKTPAYITKAEFDDFKAQITDIINRKPTTKRKEVIADE